MTHDHEALLALSEKAEPGEVFVDGDKLRLVATPKGSTYIGDQVTIALCACGPKAMSNAVLLAELWNAYRSGDLIHRSTISEETARAGEAMRERAAKVCDDRSALCVSAAGQWMEGEHPEPDIASSAMVGADQCEQAAAAIRALPLTEEAGHAER